MSSLNILLICRDAKTKDAKVKISLHLYYFIRESHRQDIKKKIIITSCRFGWGRKENCSRGVEENLDKIGEFSFSYL